MSDKDSLDGDGQTVPAEEPLGVGPHVEISGADPLVAPAFGRTGLTPRALSDGSKLSESAESGVRPAGSDPEHAARTVEDFILPGPEVALPSTVEPAPLIAPAANARRVEDFIVPAAQPNALAVGDLQWFDLPRNRPLTIEVLPAAVEVLDADEVNSAALPPEPDPARAPLLVRLGIEPGADAVLDTVELLTGAETPTIATVEPMPATATPKATAAAMTVAGIVADIAISISQTEPVVEPQVLPPPPPPPPPLLSSLTPVTEAPIASLTPLPLRERSPDKAPALKPIRTFTQPPVHRFRVQPDAQVTPSERPDEQVESGLPPQPAPVVALPRHWLRRVASFALRAAGAYAAVLIGLVVLFRFVDPPGSALIALRWVSGTEIQRSWVPIEAMSPQLVRAVIVSEDWSFCTHNGIDIEAIEQAIEKAGDGIPRGASTISMQVAKNVFLWPSKSYVRKAIEVPLTLLMEFIWPKRRILEVYLNVAEWGPGIFGAEAAAQHHFQKSASSLTAREAAQLAASLPNPFRRDAGDPGPQTARKAGIIQARMRIAGPAADCVL